MNATSEGVRNWLETAAKGIRFGPDRQAAERELWDHLEDKTADFQRIFPDMTREEAEERALGEMGDAEEIGRELARIHKPWLGYLWTVSKLALWAVVCMLLFNQWMPMTGGQKESWLGDGGMERFTRRSYNAEIVEYCELPLPEERTVGEYTFAVTWAELWTGHGEAQTGRMVYLILEEHHRRPRETLVIGRRMWAEDDQGSRILSRREYTDGAPESFDSQCIHSGVCLEAGPFWMRYEFIVPLTEPKAEGITLRYDWLGADLSIPIALKEATL